MYPLHNVLRYAYALSVPIAMSVFLNRFFD